MLRCPQCESTKLWFTWYGKDLSCHDCEYKWTLEEGYVASCFSCHRAYIKISEYDPSGCDYCHTSFVD